MDLQKRKKSTGNGNCVDKYEYITIYGYYFNIKAKKYIMDFVTYAKVKNIIQSHNAY